MIGKVACFQKRILCYDTHQQVFTKLKVDVWIRGSSTCCSCRDHGSEIWHSQQSVTLVLKDPMSFFLVSVGTRHTYFAVHGVCALNFCQTSGVFTIDVTLSIGPLICFCSVETESHYVTRMAWNRLCRQGYP